MKSTTQKIITTSISGRSIGLTVLGAAALMAGCAHVSEGDFEAEMDQIRQEMAEGDREVATRVDRVESRTDALERRMDALERALRQLEEDFDVTVERLETAIRFNTPIHFGFDEATLEDDQTPLLTRFSSVVREYYPGALVTVEGFTDPAGSAAYNLKLGQRRADAVRDWLVASGELDERRVKSVSYGEDTSRLVREGAAGPGMEGRENRRVVLVVDHVQEHAAVITEEGSG